MADVTIHMELEKADQATLDAAASAVQARLAALPEVEQAEAQADTVRFTGVEVVAAITVAVALTKGTRELAEEVPKLIETLKKQFARGFDRPQAASDEAEPAKGEEPLRVGRMVFRAGDREVILENPSEADVEALARVWASGDDQSPSR
jgi:hypothetical protein